MTGVHPDLDLKGTIRPGLDILANEIIIALKKRTRFPRNPEIYVPGLVSNRAGESLLQYELAKVERSHAELGRYAFAAQDAFSDVTGIRPIILRDTPSSPIKPMASKMGDRIIEFYKQWIQRACPEGSNINTYGETVTADVSALLNIMERVNIGKSVAEAKFIEMPDAFKATQGDRDGMLQYIVRRDRELSVLELSRNLARHYDLTEERAVEMFEFMIAITIDIEVDYLRMRIKE